MEPVPPAKSHHASGISPGPSGLMKWALAHKLPPPTCSKLWSCGPVLLPPGKVRRRLCNTAQGSLGGLGSSLAQRSVTPEFVQVSGEKQGCRRQGGGPGFSRKVGRGHWTVELEATLLGGAGRQNRPYLADPRAQS